MGKGTFKTEAAKGNVEYKPTKTFAMPGFNSDEERVQWEEEFRSILTKELKEFKPIEAKQYHDTLVSFNNNLDSPAWFWNEEGIKEMFIWTLRDVVRLMQNKKERGSK